jgi:predicted O-linked N-acetylglucosamine transferase (SPINDLY family)
LHLLSVAVYQLGHLAEAVKLGERAVAVAPRAADYRSNLGRYYLSAGRVEESIASLSRALELAPDHPAALLNLGLAHGAGQAWQAARPVLEAYVRMKPDDPAGHHQLGLTLSELGQPAAAIPYFCRTVELKPDAVEAYNNLGNALQAIGKPEESLAFYRAALERKPDYADAIANLGAAWLALGDRERALAQFEEALRIEPGMAQARGNIANLLASERRHEEAVAMFREILAGSPRSAETWNNLGNSLQEMGRYEEAMAAYARALEVKPSYHLVYNNTGNTLRRQGRYEEAVAEYRRAIEAQPDFVEAINNMAVALADLGRAAEAVELYERAAAMRPGYVDPLINLGNIYRDRARPEQAIGLFRRATEADAKNPFAWNNLGCALSDQGEVREAIACFERSLSLRPDNPHAHSNLLLNLHYTGDYTAGQIAVAHRDYGRAHGERAAAHRAPHQNTPDLSRQLRVGYVSADFRRHSVAFFIEPVLERHDRSRFAVYCYSDVGRPDAVTARLQTLAGAGWRDLRGASEESFARMVRQDAIDVLVDLGGHTANSRLASFTARPAPVQIGYLGYPNTSGLDSMGYRLTDGVADAGDYWHSEALVRLPGCFLAFRPPAEAPPVSPGPSLGGAPFTFGSFNNHAKVSDRAVAVWARLLARVPGSRLALKNKALGGTNARARLQARFAAHGIAPERLWMSGAIDSLDGHLSAYSFVDVALDTFPYAGTTTTCEALWMGVPVVTLAPPAGAHVERVGASVLRAAGLAGLIAETEDAYIEQAAALAAHPVRIAREDLRGSALLDEATLTRSLEAAYTQLFARWCTERISRNP